MIEVMSISKSFGDIKAITDISTTIREGSVFGLVGTNGAGKSTFMRILSGILKATKDLSRLIIWKFLKIFRQKS